MAHQPTRIYSPIIDQHSIWVAVNPVQGCPKGCTYCFLNELGQTTVRPSFLATPELALDLVLESEFYGPDRALALYTHTDVMALAESRAHLMEMLDLISARKLPNPVVLITKCRIPEQVVEVMQSARASGVRMVVYLSYSGLDAQIERGIRPEDAPHNFMLLSSAEIPVVHYWRPTMPSNSTAEVMHRVYNVAAAHAKCSVVAGLKVLPGAVERIGKIWPEILDHTEISRRTGVHPRAFWLRIEQLQAEHPDYPIYRNNSCALSYALSRPNAFGVHGSAACVSLNNCPLGQRDICGAEMRRAVIPSPGSVRAALTQKGLSEVFFEIDPFNRVLMIDAPLTTRVAASLSQELGIRLRVRRDDGDFYWSNDINGNGPLII